MKKEIKLAKSSSCVGCAACSDACPKKCITMSRAKDGFLYPTISTDACVSCGRCMSACPTLNKSPKNTVRNLFVGYMKDHTHALNSTSGGAFQSLALTVLEKGGVVFGAAFDEQFVLSHKSCDSVAELQPLLGSKYLQSNTEGLYKQVYSTCKIGHTVLFSGTPCQCDALKRYYEAINEDIPNNLILCEIMCHGISSPGVFGDYISYLENKIKSKVVSYNFRNKRKFGWSTLSQCISYYNGRKDIHKAKYDAWHCWFGAHLSVRECCFTCNYRDVYRVADITLGDFWSINKVLPSLETKYGISAIFVNSDKGQQCINDSADLLNLKMVDVDRLDNLFNVPIKKGTVNIPKERSEFFETYDLSGVNGLIKRFPPRNIFTAAIAKLKWMVRKK